jgi:hypothetical protein
MVSPARVRHLWAEENTIVKRCRDPRRALRALGWSSAQNHIHLVFSTKGRLKLISKDVQPRPRVHRDDLQKELDDRLPAGEMADHRVCSWLSVAPFGASLDTSSPRPHGRG